MINRRVLWEHDYSNDYLTFVAREDNTRFTFYRGSLANIDSMQCSINGGNTWVSLYFANNNVITSPEINAGEKILWKCIGLGTCTGSWQNEGDASYFGTLNNETFDVEGNIMSLLYGDNFKDQNEFPTSNDQYTYNFMFLFSNDSSEGNGANIVNAKKLILPITTLTKRCYQYMFSKCTSLITAPEKLPAITLTQDCYSGMFRGCTSLITAPELPATTLAGDCYDQMFAECTSLETAPELPAIELVSNCYAEMFYGCSSLNYIKALFITTPPGSDYTYNWVYGVANYGLFVTSKYITWNPADYCTADGNGIPINWIISKGNQNNQNIEPPYEEINSNNYITITNATSVTLNKLSSHQTLYISKDHVNWVRMKTYKSYITDGNPVYMCGMLTRDNSLTNYTNIKFTGSNISISGNCNSIWNYININASLKKYCGFSLFSGNPIKSCPELPSIELSQGCYEYMFYGCTELTSPPKLPATSLVNECYLGMFRECTSLVKAPKLPALLLVTDCYKEMFYGCSSLNCVEALFRTTPESTYTQYWLYNVSSTGYFANKDEQSWFNTITRSADTIPSGWNFVTGYEAQYCTLVAIQKITVNWQGSCDLSYSIDDGNTWFSFNVNEKKFDAGTRILIKGSNGISGGNCGEFSISSPFYVEGNVMSAVWGDNFIGKYSFPSFTPNSMFKNCTGLRNAENLILPATTLKNYCYQYMFYNCSGLTTAPVLPATTLKNYCYQYMFYNCSGLTTAPVLPATALTNYCYRYMFNGCTELTTAPELPATTLANSCYGYMFNGCTGLTTAPKLPATTLSNSCYERMFQGCTSLTTAPVLPATALTNYCYQSMFQGCTGLTTAPELPATTLATSCYNSMFYGCTGLTTAPELPVTTLANYCYSSMFYGCTGLTTAPELPAIILAGWCYNSMFYNCAGLTAAPELPATTLATSCYNSMFQGCTGLTTAPELPATTLAFSCYGYMFQSCRNLRQVKAAFITTPGSSYTRSWLYNVASTGTFYKNNAATWTTTGTSGVPSGWTVVKYTP